MEKEAYAGVLAGGYIPVGVGVLFATNLLDNERYGVVLACCRRSRLVGLGVAYALYGG